MDTYKMFNQSVTPKAVVSYLSSHGLSKSKAVETNISASKKLKSTADVLYEHIGMDGELYKPMFDKAVSMEQQSNAYLYLAIYTAKQEQRLGLHMMGDMNSYIDHVLSNGTGMNDEKKEVVDLMRYFHRLADRVKKHRNLGSFYENNLQFWFMYYDSLKDKEDQHEKV